MGQTLHVYTRYTCIYTVMLASNTYTYIHGQNKVDDMIFMAVNYGRGHVKKMASVWRCSHSHSLLPVLHSTTSLSSSSSETENSHVVFISENNWKNSSLLNDVFNYD